MEMERTDEGRGIEDMETMRNDSSQDVEHDDALIRPLEDTAAVPANGALFPVTASSSAETPSTYPFRVSGEPVAIHLRMLRRQCNSIRDDLTGLRSIVQAWHEDNSKWSLKCAKMARAVVARLAPTSSGGGAGASRRASEVSLVSPHGGSMGFPLADGFSTLTGRESSLQATPQTIDLTPLIAPPTVRAHSGGSHSSAGGGGALGTKVITTSCSTGITQQLTPPSTGVSGVVQCKSVPLPHLGCNDERRDASAALQSVEHYALELEVAHQAKHAHPQPPVVVGLMRSVGSDEGERTLRPGPPTSARKHDANSRPNRGELHSGGGSTSRTSAPGAMMGAAQWLFGTTSIYQSDRPTTFQPHPWALAPSVNSDALRRKVLLMGDAHHNPSRSPPSLLPAAATSWHPSHLAHWSSPISTSPRRTQRVGSPTASNRGLGYPIGNSGGRQSGSESPSTALPRQSEVVLPDAASRWGDGGSYSRAVERLAAPTATSETAAANLPLVVTSTASEMPSISGHPTTIPSATTPGGAANAHQQPSARRERVRKNGVVAPPQQQNRGPKLQSLLASHQDAQDARPKLLIRGGGKIPSPRLGGEANAIVVEMEGPGT